MTAATRSVLIVDDANFFRATLRDLLVRSGSFHVAGEAANGREAIDEYRRAHPDLVLMDIVMPEMDGIQATRAILRDHPEAVIVMCSTAGQEALLVEAIEAGARDFILKPVSEQRLLAVLRKIAGPSPAAPGGPSR